VSEAAGGPAIVRACDPDRTGHNRSDVIDDLESLENQIAVSAGGVGNLPGDGAMHDLLQREP
jgi:hypothetical protein